MLVGSFWLQGASNQATSSTWFRGQGTWELEQGLESWQEARQQ